MTTGQRMLNHLEEVLISYRLLGEARVMQMSNRWLVAEWNDVAGLLFRILSALLFLLQSRLLSDHPVSEGCLVYPYSALQTWLQQAKSDQGRKLLVDIVLVEAALGDAADPRSPLREGSPSLSIHSATDIYPVCGLEPWTPHVVTYYLLLNIAIIFHDYPPVKEKLKHFPSAIDLSIDVQILVDDIRHLDQGRHEEGEECLLKAQQQASAELRPLLGALWAPAHPRSTDQDTDEKKASGPGSGQTSYLEGKTLLREFLHAPSADDSAAAGPAQPEAKESLSQPSPAAAAPNLAVSVETSDEEGLNGTPLMDSYEDTVPESKSRPHFPPHGKDLSRGPVVTAPEERKGIPRWVAGAAHVGIAQLGTGPVSTAQLGVAELGTPYVSTSLDGSQHVGTTNFGTAKFGPAHFGTAHFGNSQASAHQFGTPAEAGEPTPLCDNDGTELVEGTASRCFSLASAVSLHVPAFALSEEQHTPEEEDEPVIEQHGVIISAFEAPEREQEEKGDGVVLSYTCTEALLQMQPTRMESPEASWSRSSGLSTRKTEAPLDELSNMEESPSHGTTRSGA
ncbi:hypothetical protein V5799_019887 [Amblyomma americanum]|uniref:Uncharacterized protein n=1 Tax=Amblyomma americanum TaxID=6943 RepID=A0AAQ4EV97_AMBAM